MTVVFSKEVVDAPAIEGEGKPRRNAFLPDGKLVVSPKGVSTLYENFLQGVKISGQSSVVNVKWIGKPLD